MNVKIKILLFITCANLQICYAQFSDRPTVKAVEIETGPVLDGDVLNDPIWRPIGPIKEMIQIRPDKGSPASENTEIRIAYTPTMLYVSVVCYDDEPHKLVVSDSRRDASLDGTDSFLFILDTFNDGQNGFLFGTSSIGVEYDGQVNNEGQGNFGGGRQQGGTASGFNLNWDASWDVRAEVGEYGWSAEFAIPFRSLRFNSGENQVWGINFQRNIRKRNEVAYWAPLPMQFDINRLSLAGHMEGLNLKSPGNLKLVPYVLGKATKDFETDSPQSNIGGDVGMDVKYSITPGMTLDLTYNTDFAQVEVDNEQINLDRFNLFFPEKRPFFLENAGQFSIGSPGEVDMFFSRRIGIGDDGQLVPIIGGARMSGKLKDTYVGLLSMFTREVVSPDVAIQKNNFTVVRVNHQLAKRSSIGAAFLNRQGLGGLQDGISPTNPKEYNRTYAMDGRLGIGKRAQFSGFYAQTKTPGIEKNDYSYRLQGQYSWNVWFINMAYTQVEENFNPEMGFLSRKGFRKPELRVLYQARLREGNKFKLLEVRPHISYRGYWDANNFQQTGYLHIDNHWEWRSGFQVHTGFNLTTEGLDTDFEISDGVIVDAGTYKHVEAQFVIMTNPSKNVYLSTRHTWGGAFGGSRYINNGTIGVRLGDKFNSEYKVQQNNFNLPNGNFSATVFGSRISYSFAPRVFAQSLIQFNSVAKVWSANIRFGLLEQANTGLFMVYNESWGKNEWTALDPTMGFQTKNRSFTIKYTHMFDVIR